MRLLIYEWCCSGGLRGADAPQVVGAGDVAPLLREGRAMFEALVTDAVRDGGFDVVAATDRSLQVDLPAAARRLVVRPATELATLVEAAGHADAAIIVAPETAGVLAARVAAVRAAGTQVLAPGDAFIRLAADKQATADALAAAGVPVPAGRSLAAGEPWPEGFHRPAVRKARASTGCDGLVRVGRDDPPPRPAADATRLEAWCTGIPVGVSCVLGPSAAVPVATMRQGFTPDTHAYVGGRTLGDAAARLRAESLAVRAIVALARRDPVPSAGWVGVDMILGSRSDGLDDRVLEVNPRVTTSFVGLATAASASLVRVIVDAADGRPVDRHVCPDACGFSLADDVPRPAS